MGLRKILVFLVQDNKEEMINFSDFRLITESLGAIYNWKWTTKTKEDWTAEFSTSSGDKVEVIFQILDPRGLWEVAFSRNERTDVTNEGDAFRIMATVLDIVRIFAVKKKPEILTFSSANVEKGGSSSGRTRLYKTIVKKYAPSFGYSLEDLDDMGDNAMFYIKRK